MSGDDGPHGSMYHFKLCRAILVGFRRQLQSDGTCKEGFIGMMAREHETEALPVYMLKDDDGSDVVHC